MTINHLFICISRFLFVQFWIERIFCRLPPPSPQSLLSLLLFISIIRIFEKPEVPNSCLDLSAHYSSQFHPGIYNFPEAAFESQVCMTLIMLALLFFDKRYLLSSLLILESHFVISQCPHHYANFVFFWITLHKKFPHRKTAWQSLAIFLFLFSSPLL